METKSAPPLFARITLGVSALLMVGVVYWYVSQVIKDTPIPPVPPLRKAQSFNVKADVSKNKVFSVLEEDILQPIPDFPMGRENPFVPLTIKNVATSSIPAQGLEVPGTKLIIVPATTTPVEFFPVTNSLNNEPIIPEVETTSTVL